MEGKLIVALGVLALCAGAAIAAPAPDAEPAAPAAADACAPSFNFFPTADEIGEPQLVNNKTCIGKDVCNFPSVWQKANQTKYMSVLKTDLDSGLLKVAFKQYGNEKPRLFFTPHSPLLIPEADVTACAESLLPGPPATRRLLAPTGEAYRVAYPGKWSYTVSYDGGAPVAGNKIAGRAGELVPEKLNQQGDHCATVTITIEGAKITPAIADFPNKLTSSQTICWYKMSTQARATFDFDMCNTKAFTVNVTGIRPLAQNLTQNGTAVQVNGKQAMLFRPVVHLFGQKNRSLDGTVLRELEYDNMNNPINFINKYIPIPTTFTENDTLSLVLDEDQLDEGYYKLSAKVAIISQFPELMDLEGENPIVQSDAYGEDVRGYTEYLGVTVINETSMVGVQKSMTTISQITSDKVGRSIQQDEPITFTWHFAGIGKERCFHDDVEIPDCSSGLVVRAKEVGEADKVHTFRVEFTDVCGNTKDAEYTYTQQGVKPISQIDYIPVTNGDMKELLGGTPKNATVQNAAAAPAAGGLATAAAALLGSLLVAAAL